MKSGQAKIKRKELKLTKGLYVKTGKGPNLAFGEFSLKPDRSDSAKKF